MMKKAFVLIVFIGLVVSFHFPDQKKGVKSTLEPFYRGCKIGKQYLVLIAIDKYQHWRPLQNPVKDAKEIGNILTSRYHIDNVIELYNKKATKKAIIKLLRDFQGTIQTDDSLLVFYSGHGHLDDVSNNGFWIPVDGGKDRDVKERWIFNSEIRGIIRNMNSKHILIIVDSCFSGDLLETNKGEYLIDNEYYRKAYTRRCRQALTSGAIESVPDDPAFSRQLMLALKENNRPYIDALKLYDEIRLGMKKTMPLFGEIKGTDHQQGAGFLFFLKDRSRGVEDDLAFETAKEAGTIQAYNDYINNHPTGIHLSEAYKGRGSIYYKKGELEQAIADYTKAIEFNPKYAVAYNNRGCFYGYLGKYDKAISDLSKAIELNPKYYRAFYSRGNAYRYLGKHKQAISDYIKVLELNPKNYKAFNNRGVSYKNLGKYNKAISDYKEAIKIKPDFVKAYNNMAHAYEKLGKTKEAEETRAMAEKLEKQTKDEKKPEVSEIRYSNPFGKKINNKAKRIYKNNKGFWEADYGDGIVMVYIPAGEFTMGSNDYESEKPPHTVYLDGYWMGKTEVNVNQYMEFVNETNSHYPLWLENKNKYNIETAKTDQYKIFVSSLKGDNYPAVGISWDDASAYCQWLSEKTGLRFHLPSEAQWEKAARGTDSRTYPWGDSQPSGKEANFADRQNWLKLNSDWATKSIDDGYAFAAPVGSYPQGASPYGLLDMSGNVWEWCGDWYDKNYYKNSPKKNPEGPISGSNRVYRGGCWYNLAGHLRCALRDREMSSARDNFGVGFRLCQED